jgi:hypothetical protein
MYCCRLTTASASSHVLNDQSERPCGSMIPSTLNGSVLHAAAMETVTLPTLPRGGHDL